MRRISGLPVAVQRNRNVPGKEGWCLVTKCRLAAVPFCHEYTGLEMYLTPPARSNDLDDLVLISATMTQTVSSSCSPDCRAKPSSKAITRWHPSRVTTAPRRRYVCDVTSATPVLITAAVSSSRYFLKSLLPQEFFNLRLHLPPAPFRKSHSLTLATNPS